MTVLRYYILSFVIYFKCRYSFFFFLRFAVFLFMARGTTLNWKTLTLYGFIAICVMLYGNSFVWTQTTIFYTENTHSSSNLESNDLSTGGNYSAYDDLAYTNDTDNTPKPTELKEAISISNVEQELESDDINTDSNLEQIQENDNYNLYKNPYDSIGTSMYLNFLIQSDYEEFSECIFRINKDNPRGKCKLSSNIKFYINDVIGKGNHGKILSANIEFKHYLKKQSLPIHIDLENMKTKKYALKFTDDNETCSILQFEYNIMQQIGGKDSMKQYHLTNLHRIIPWIEWMEINRFTRIYERRCMLIMEQIENVKTFEGIIQKKYAPSFEFDNGLLSFIINCYHDLMIAFQRIWTFSYYHIDINGVNILVWPRHNITSKRICYLIDYGGMFAMPFDAKTKKEFTGKSHNYSPFAYYNLHLYENRESTNWNLTKLNYFGRKDNQYRIICELIRMYLEYAKLDKNEIFTDLEWQFIEKAKEKQREILHITPVGINPTDSEYIQKIWCLRQIEIDYIKRSNLGSKLSQQNVKMEFLKLLDILQDAPIQTNAISDKICKKILSKG